MNNLHICNPGCLHTHKNTHAIISAGRDGVSGRSRKHLWVWEMYQVRHTNAFYVRLTLCLVSNSTAHLWCSFTGWKIWFSFFRQEFELQFEYYFFFLSCDMKVDITNFKKTQKIDEYFVNLCGLHWRVESQYIPRNIIFRIYKQYFEHWSCVKSRYAVLKMKRLHLLD